MTKQKRKSPCRHRVKDHRRKGRTISSYMRGKGNSFPRRNLVVKVEKEDLHKPHELRQYTVVFKYENKTSETVTPVGHSPLEALLNAKKMRKRKDRPVEVTIKNTLGDIIAEMVIKGPELVERAAKVYTQTKGGGYPPAIRRE